MNDHTVDPTLCAAYGCPCKGTMTHSSSGTDKWYCGHHFGTDAASWSRITNELNRLGYIVTAMQKINAMRDKSSWPDVYRSIKQEFVLNSRTGLLCQQNERLSDWYQRLDLELQNACKGRRPSHDLLPPVTGPVVDPGASDSWNRVQLSVPEHA